MKQSFIYAFSLLFIFTSCTPNPYNVDVKLQNDSNLSCNQIITELNQANQYKIDAREKDKFMMRYIFPPTALIAIFQINRAEKNAIRRIGHLEKIYMAKNCNIAQ